MKDCSSIFSLNGHQSSFVAGDLGERLGLSLMQTVLLQCSSPSTKDLELCSRNSNFFTRSVACSSAHTSLFLSHQVWGSSFSSSFAYVGICRIELCGIHTAKRFRILIIIFLNLLLVGGSDIMEQGVYTWGAQALYLGDQQLACASIEGIRRML